MKPSNSDSKERPEKGLECQLKLAEKIYQLTTRQREAIRSENWEGLKDILYEKDRLIHQFQDMKECLQELKARRKTPGDDPSLRTMLSRIESRLMAVQSLEQECRRILTGRRNQVAKSLQEIKRARQGIKRFRPHRPGGPRFVDLHK